MKPALLARAMPLFARLCDLDHAEQEQRLATECAGDGELEGLVRSLLEGDRDPLTCLDSVELATSFEEGPGDELGEVPEYVGRYRILEVLGSGGMGIVYKAEQKLPKRLVALKVIRPQFVTSGFLRQFEYEAEVLGLLSEHPGIAPVFEAGTAETARGPVPFIVMDLIEGQSLTTYAATRALALVPRVELLAKLGDAVHHAHKQGIVHRDLKPANLLVKADGTPKIVDFGIACPANAQGAGLLGAKGLIGTLPYMSPEQCSHVGSRINIQSDIYSLAVVGYELITGRLPYAVAGSDVRTVRDTIREAPAAVLAIEGSANAADLQAVFAKALAKDPAQRYDAASAFAADLRRWTRFEPVEARGAGKLHRVRLAVRRNRVLSGLLAALLVALALGAGGTRWEAQAAERSALAAEDSARRKNAANEFVEEIFEFAQPAGARGEDVSMAQALARAAARVESSLRGDPIVRADVHGLIGRCYAGLARYESAQSHLQAAQAVLERTLGAEHPDSLAARGACYALQVQRGDLARPAAGLQDVYERLRAGVGDADERTLRAGHDWAEALYRASDYAQAQELLATIVEQRTRVLGKDDRDTLVSLAAQANVLAVLGRLDEAELLFHDALAGLRSALGDDHPETLITLSNWCGLLFDQGEYERALESMRLEFDTTRRTLGEDHPDTQVSRNNLAMCLTALERHDEARRLLLDAIGHYERGANADHPDCLLARHNLADLYADQGRVGEAEAAMKDVLADRRRVLGPAHDDTLLSLNYYGTYLLRLGRVEAAAAEYERGLRDLAHAGDTPQPFRGVFLKELGLCRKALGDHVAAERLLLQSLDELGSGTRELDHFRGNALSALIEIYETAGDATAALEFRRLREELEPGSGD